jgi:hypothetical protein
MHLLMLKYLRFLYASKRDYLCINDGIILGASDYLRIQVKKKSGGFISNGCDVMNCKVGKIP